MKIFSREESSSAPREGAAVKKAARGKKRAASAASGPSEKKAIGENEIREKLAAHVETSNTAKSKVLQQNSKQFGAGFMNSDVKPAPPIPVEAKEKAEAVQGETEEKDSVKDSHLLMSDVKLNDPKDPTTQEKLKTVLSKGAFNFNPREREALDKILNGSN